jgi:hypothetical protein
MSGGEASGFSPPFDSELPLWMYRRQHDKANS